VVFLLPIPIKYVKRYGRDEDTIARMRKVYDVETLRELDGDLEEERLWRI
jgi:hypothetical protein